MPQIEGLYVVEFGDVAIGGQTYYCNGGVVVLETNHIFGGDRSTFDGFFDAVLKQRPGLKERENSSHCP